MTSIHVSKIIFTYGETRGHVKSSSTPGRCTNRCVGDYWRACPQRTARVRTPPESCSPSCGSRRSHHCFYLYLCLYLLETSTCRPMRRPRASSRFWPAAGCSSSLHTPRSSRPWERLSNECLLWRLNERCTGR